MSRITPPNEASFIGTIRAAVRTNRAGFEIAGKFSDVALTVTGGVATNDQGGYAYVVTATPQDKAEPVLGEITVTLAHAADRPHLSHGIVDNLLKTAAQKYHAPQP